MDFHGKDFGSGTAARWTYGGPLWSGTRGSLERGQLASQEHGRLARRFPASDRRRTGGLRSQHWLSRCLKQREAPWGTGASWFSSSDSFDAPWAAHEGPKLATLTTGIAILEISRWW